MKEKRQNLIIRLIKEQNVETQEELLLLLEKEGFNTTQATISRDIRELNLKKVSYDGGKKKYAVKERGDDNELSGEVSYYQTLKNCIVSMDYAENIIVVKTVSGMAMAVGASVDRLNISGILGCIAGDDTLFLAIKDKTQAERIIGEINDVIKYTY
ncbi:MAG: arginine repressor [Lachnospiraceae bacterium]|nr:arginine repressor [Lachnospiraceae bacterium]